MRFHNYFGLWLFIFLSPGLLQAEELHSVLRENFKMVLSANQEGPILLYVEEGAHVSIGDKLFGMEPEELELKVQLAKVQWEQTKAHEKKIKNPHHETELKHAELKFKQEESLYHSGGISQDAFEIAKLAYELATLESREEDVEVAESNVEIKRIQLDLAENGLRKATFITPVDGRIHQLLVRPNEWVRPGQEVLELINVNPVFLLVNVPLKSITKVTPSKPLEVLISTGVEEVKTQGIVKHISDEVDAVSQTIPVRLEIMNETKLFKPGMRAQVVLSDELPPAEDSSDEPSPEGENSGEPPPPSGDE